MDVTRDRNGWPKLVGEREWVKTVFRAFKLYDRKLTVTVATLALVSGLISIFVLEWFQWIRLVLSFLTLLFALLTFSSLVELQVSGSAGAEMTAELTVGDEVDE